VAQLAAPQQAKIERELSQALREWNRLPAVEAEFPGWPEDAALDFVFEWSLAEDRLRRLARHAERGELTARQQERYGELIQTVARCRPIVERLING
jgi:hypothetical protein